MRDESFIPHYGKDTYDFDNESAVYQVVRPDIEEWFGAWTSTKNPDCTVHVRAATEEELFEKKIRTMKEVGEHAYHFEDDSRVKCRLLADNSHTWIGRWTLNESKETISKL